MKLGVSERQSVFWIAYEEMLDEMNSRWVPKVASKVEFDGRDGTRDFRLVLTCEGQLPTENDVEETAKSPEVD